MLTYGPATCALDLATTGKRTGFIDVAHSDDRLAYSSIRVPIAIIANGTGPTVIVSAGNHGDEYEGQVIAHELFHRLTPDMIDGRVIFLPALNMPAVTARSRVSPLDNANMNRIFPGRPDAGPSAAIAGFVSEHLIPGTDLVIDLHSGGTTANYLVCGFVCLGPDAALNARNVELAEKFAAPHTAVMFIDGSEGAFDCAAHANGTMFLATELGGMGAINPDARHVGNQGTLRLLRHLGLLSQQIFGDLGGTPPAEITNYFDYSAGNIDLHAAHHGLADAQVRLGDEVASGDHVATIYDIHNIGRIAQELSAPHAGIVTVIRRNPLVDPGDKVLQIAPPLSREAIHSYCGR